MNLILLFAEDLQNDGTARLTGRRAAHIYEVHRACPGDVLNAGLFGGPLGRATVLAASPKEVILNTHWDSCPPKGAGIDLLLALPRPKVLRRVVSALTTLGVKRLVLVQSYRVEKSYWGSPFLQEEALQQAIALGLEQARDTIPPIILLRRRFRPFVEDETGELWPEGWQRLLAHPGKEKSLEDLSPIPADQRVVLAVGPEGGWIPFEIELLEKHGFSGFTLGPRILRVDTVLPYLLGKIELLRRLPEERSD